MVRNILLGSLIFIIILVIATGLFIYVQINKMEPDYTGQIYLKGLTGKTYIVRDSNGVIHIEGETTADVIFASGYVTAQERLWQMDMMRRISKGQLSEVFGDTTVAADRLFQTLGLDSITMELYSKISEESRQWLIHYSSGINAYMDEIRDEFPLEFILMDFTPEKWTPQDCLLQNRLMAWLLNFNWKADFFYWQLAKKLPQAKFSEILPRSFDYPEIISPGPLKKGNPGISEITRQLYNFLGINSFGAGSNSWVIAPGRSENGKALLANDPHLQMQFPSVWIELHLSSPDLEVAGFSFPGSPGIIIGRNKDISWGLTSGMIDDCDYFIEAIDTVNLYYVNGKDRRPLAVKDRVIRVKDKADINFRTYYTDKGPIFNGVLGISTEKTPISLRWTGWEFSDELRCFIELARSKNWSDFEKALQSYGVPAQNFIFADSEGNIGYRLAGKIPVRSYEDGVLPRNGSDIDMNWSSWVPFRKMPSLLNPSSGYIVTANNKIDESFSYYLSEYWEPPYRSLRIHELIRAAGKISSDDMRRFQLDNRDLLAEEIIPVVISELFRIPDLTDDEEKVVLMWKNWDYTMDEESIPAAIYEVFKFYLIRNIFLDEMGEDLFQQFTDLPNFYFRIFAGLFDQEESLWYDDMRTVQQENRSDIIRISFRDALSFMENSMSHEMEDWRWGKIHQLTFRHVLGQIPLTDIVLNRGPFPAGGNGTTVNVGSYIYDKTFRMIVGPSMRFITDWSQPDGYFSILAGGNSGNFLSDFYDNQISDWREGRLKRIIMKEITDSELKMELLPFPEN
ncbi:MAG: penicillin acylase family protein [Calditrichaeota bacterium]|nr:penicillin acylase family protein [Calditrichota bacterium]RQW01489.1 MAG: penicillin acylase family protein [Calditrichota bacterium]